MYRCIGAIMHKSVSYISKVIDIATNKLYKYFAVPHFEKINREYVIKNTTDFSKKVLGLTDPRSAILLMDGVSIEVEKPS